MVIFVGPNCADQAFNNQSATCILPELVIKEILKNVSDQETMMQCRLVCKQWNNMIVDNSELMRKITFPVWSNLTKFLNLDIVKKRKVRSICFKDSLVQHFKIDEFMDAIKDTVEKVVFDLEETARSAEDQRDLFLTIIKECTCLQEIKIEFSVMGNNMLGLINTKTKMASAMQLKIITVDLFEIDIASAKGFSKLLLKLPNLEEINLYGYADIIILNGIAEYLKKFKKTLKLKVIINEK